MREILFRGKRIDNGEWVEGFVRQYPIGTVTIFDEDVMCESNVVPESVGQYTGLKDVNGKPIFEGDIVNQWDWNAVVEYGMFNCSCCDGVYGWYFNDADIRSSNSCAVIGNIHDNPELLKEA